MPVSPRIIVVFLKFPVLGKVKTRLAAGLSHENPGEEAVSIYKRLVSTVFEILSQSEFDQLRIQFDPPEAEADIRGWLQPELEKFPDSISIDFFPQAAGDLGDRLQTGISDVFHENPNARIATIGTDCVEISPSTFSETWKHLETTSDLVFGPTFDGGYYLVASSKPVPEIFIDIPWSTEKTLSASLQKANAAGRTTTLLDQLNDVDTADDWLIAEKQISRTNRVRSEKQ